MVDTHGVPLELVLDRLQDHGYLCDWVEFWKDSLEAGWKPDRTWIKLTNAIGDVYGPDFREEWERRMKLWLDSS